MRRSPRYPLVSKLWKPGLVAWVAGMAGFALAMWQLPPELGRPAGMAWLLAVMTVSGHRGLRGHYTFDGRGLLLHRLLYRRRHWPLESIREVELTPDTVRIVTDDGEVVLGPEVPTRVLLARAIQERLAVRDGEQVAPALSPEAVAARMGLTAADRLRLQPCRVGQELMVGAVVLAAAIGLYLLLAAMGSIQQGAAAGGLLAAGLGLLTGAGALFGAMWLRSHDVVVDGDGLTLRGPVVRRHIAWHEVRNLVDEGRVLSIDTDTFRLRLPRDDPDARHLAAVVREVLDARAEGHGLPRQWASDTALSLAEEATVPVDRGLSRGGS